MSKTNKTENKSATTKSKAKTMRKAPSNPFPMGSLKRQVQQILEDTQSNNRYVPSVSAAKFISMAGDPFGQGEDGAPILTRIPDGNSAPSAIVKLTGRFTLAGTTATAGFIKLNGYSVISSTSAKSITYTYGADPYSADMTAAAYKDDDEAALSGPMIPATAELRPLAMGLRVIAISGDTVTSGALQGGLTKSPLTYASTPGYTPSNNISSKLSNNIFTAKDGITVRYKVDRDYLNFKAPPTYHYDQTGPYGPTPVVCFSGLSTTTVLAIEWIHMYEVIPLTKMPNEMATVPFDSEFERAIYMQSILPYVVSGHSFKSFIRDAWNNIKKTGKFVWDNRDTIANVVKTGVALASKF